MKTVQDFIKMRIEGRKISMVTCYDYWSARIINDSDIDAIIVGDSAAMVMHGYDTTIHATVDMMAFHVNAVCRGAPDKFIVADMPFLVHRKGIREVINAVDKLMKANAHAVKIEGTRGHLDVISYIVESGIPVMGHLGLTPQSVHQLGGFKVQARDETSAEQLMQDAISLQEAGCFAMVLECVPRSVAAQVTQRLNIPTIGIGAGWDTSGQVLVLQDLLGMNLGFKPKFLRTYLNGYELFKTALNRFNEDVKTKKFPNEEESYQ